jgi:hypothetical protein
MSGYPTNRELARPCHCPTTDGNGAQHYATCGVNAQLSGVGTASIKMLHEIMPVSNQYATLYTE